MAKPSPESKPAAAVPPKSEPVLAVTIQRTGAGKYAVHVGRLASRPVGLEVVEEEQSFAVAWGAVSRAALRLRKYLTDGRW